MRAKIFLLTLSCAAVAGDRRVLSQELARVAPHRCLGEGRDGLVVGLSGKQAVHAGAEILKQGGSAADAAMATAMSQIAEAAGSYVSFAGILSMVYYDANARQYHYLNAGYNTPIDETDPLSIPKADLKADLKGGTGVPSGRTALVPGFMAGVQAAHDRFGKLPLARLVAPAIALAEEGIDVDPVLASFIEYRRDVLGRLPETRRVFTRPDGAFYRRGDRFRQTELAATLRRVSEQGVAGMYNGEWARHFVDAVRRDGGKITLGDLKAYRATWEAPIQTNFLGARVVAPGLSSRGGVDLVEALQVAELAGLEQLGPPARNSEGLFWLMQITKNQLVFETPEPIASRYPGRDFSPRARLAREHARWFWDRLKSGELPFVTKLAGGGEANGRPRHSSGVVAVDRWGNVAAVTHSINAVLWGTTGIFVDGVSIPDSASFQQDEIQRAGPGHRLPEPMNPLIVARDGHPVVASTATGGGLHQRSVQVVANIVAFGLDAQAAAEAPAFLSPDWMGSKSVAQVAAGAFDAKVLAGVRTLGQEVRELGPAESVLFVGYWAGIAIDRPTGRLCAAGGTEAPTFAEGY